MPTLHWVGKEAVLNHHEEVPFHLLQADPTLSVGDPDSGNLLVEGDNLLALKALLPYYAGKVKCIYIDPPYNIGSESWVYNDNVNSPEIREWLGKVVGKEGVDLPRHDKWLCMMYPRLNLLSQFLRRDGVIIVAIDDNELAHLRVLMDSIFGGNNWIATLTWEKTRKNDAKLFSKGHDYMLVFARDKQHLKDIGTVWREAKPGAAEIIDKYNALKRTHGDDFRTMENELREWYRQLPDSHPSKRLSRYKNIDEAGVWRDRDISWPGGGGPTYDVIHPVTGKPCAVPERGWGFATPEAMQREIDNGYIQFRDDHTEPPLRKAWLNFTDDDDEGEVGGQVMSSVIYRHTQPSVRLLRRIMGAKVFNNPKDHEVLARLFEYVTDEGDIILDSFGGSGSTGHAVLHVNQKTLSNRQFILVEMEKHIAQEITAERLRRVVNGYKFKGKERVKIYFDRLTVTNFKKSAKILKDFDRVKKERQADFTKFETKIEEGQIVLYGVQEVKGKTEGLGGGFRYCRLGETLFDATGSIRETVTFAELARHVFFSEAGSPLSDVPHSPLIGTFKGAAIYLLYNGVLHDAQPDGGNVLTRALLATLPKHDGTKIIYANGCLIAPATLAAHNTTFRQTPYEIKVS